MSDLENDYGNIIMKNAKDLYVHNFNVQIVDGEDHPYAYLKIYDPNADLAESKYKRRNNIIYNIKRSNNKIKDMDTLEKAIDYSERMIIYYDDQIKEMEKRMEKSETDKEDIEFLKGRSYIYESEIKRLDEHLQKNEQLQNDESHKTGGKRKTKKYNFRRHKSKKNKKLKLKN